MNYFVISGLAADNSFCNRENERKKLAYNIETNAATLVISPRRYGKTSLIHQVFRDTDTLFANIDLYKALSEQDIVDFTLTGIGELLGQMEPIPEKLLKVAGQFFSGLQVGLSAKGYGFSVQWDQKNKKPIEILTSALGHLDTYAKKRNMKVAIYFDEFQSVYQVMRQSYSIEAAIREMAQQATNVVYVFSGSTRHIIDGMFNDKTRPLYRLCDIIYLKRINSEYYIPYIEKAARERWGKKIDNKMITRILELTENYPYYVNKLCHLLWSYEQPPSIESIEQSWKDYAYESKMSIDKQIDELSLNQKRIMIKLCQMVTHEPFGSQIAHKWNMNSASIHQAIKVLIEKDHVYQREDGAYDVLDPLVKAALSL